MIRVRPDVDAWAESPEDWKALADGLREQGIEVELVEPLAPDRDLRVHAAGMDVAIDVAEQLRDPLIALIVEELIRRVAKARKNRRDGRPVMGVIYGPDGEIIREVMLTGDKDRGPS